jgi:hypothetical protein
VVVVASGITCHGQQRLHARQRQVHTLTVRQHGIGGTAARPFGLGHGRDGPHTEGEQRQGQIVLTDFIGSATVGRLRAAERWRRKQVARWNSIGRTMVHHRMRIPRRESMIVAGRLLHRLVAHHTRVAGTDVDRFTSCFAQANGKRTGRISHMLVD